MKIILMTRIVLIGLCIICFSCKKFLDEKPDSSLAVPSTIIDLQLLMDDYQTLNSQYPNSAELLADDYYTESWNDLPEDLRNQYFWSDAELLYANPWALCYRNILTFNVVLDNIDKVSYKKGEAALVSHIKGSALFFRAFYFYGLAQLFAKPFNPNTAKSEPGIVLRNTSDFNVFSVRSTNDETYRQIILDLKQSVELLPESQSSPNRPTKAAALGLLARVCLGMKDYISAGSYAKKALVFNSQLMNFNELNDLSSAPINRFNKEVIFPMLADHITRWVPSFADTSLVKSYHENDLRKTCFYQLNDNGSYQFKGDYNGIGLNISNPSPFVFAGLATDELYLVKAECEARTGTIDESMKTLNDLLITRWKTGTFIPLVASNLNHALTHILTERRKELVFRSVRWEDLRRLQDDPLFSITPKRVVNGKEYTLPPNSQRYLLKIPSKVIAQTGMPQNP